MKSPVPLQVTVACYRCRPSLSVRKASMRSIFKRRAGAKSCRSGTHGSHVCYFSLPAHDGSFIRFGCTFSSSWECCSQPSAISSVKNECHALLAEVRFWQFLAPCWIHIECLFQALFEFLCASNFAFSLGGGRCSVAFLFQVYNSGDSFGGHVGVSWSSILLTSWRAIFRRHFRHLQAGILGTGLGRQG